MCMRSVFKVTVLSLHYKLEILTCAEAINDSTRTAFTSISSLNFLCLCPLYSKDLLTLNMKLTKHDDPRCYGERQVGLCFCRSGSHLWMPVKIRITLNELDAGFQISFLTHQPSGLVDEKIHQNAFMWYIYFFIDHLQGPQRTGTQLHSGPPPWLHPQLLP